MVDTMKKCGRIDRCPVGTGSFEHKQRLATEIYPLQIPARRSTPPRNFTLPVKPVERIERSSLLVEF